MIKGVQALWKDEDWWAVWLGFALLGIALLEVIPKVPGIGKWTDNPLTAFSIVENGTVTGYIFLPLLILMIGLGLLTAIAVVVMKTEKFWRYLAGFVAVFILACISYWIAHQININYWGLSYAMWALIIGLLISNTIGTPRWVRAAAKTELFIKIGLVLLGAEILFGQILSLGIPGLMVAWIVTPIVIIFMYIFAVRVLKMKNKSLAIIIASATSVCGVSAAIAAAAACCAKKEDLTLAVGMTLIFTVLMMVLMPIFIGMVGMNAILGAAWMGGTIDSTGAVVAAGSMLGETAGKVAAVVKMIQNVLIGVVAFFIALFWVTRVERDPNCAPNAMEIWYRFPKFVIGFVGASLIFSFIVVPAMKTDGQPPAQSVSREIVANQPEKNAEAGMVPESSEIPAAIDKLDSIADQTAVAPTVVESDKTQTVKPERQIKERKRPRVEKVLKKYINPITKVFRGWFFCLAFVAIGLESNFRDLVSRMEGGKPMILYVVGQSFNLILTLLVAYLAFMVLFPNSI